MTTAATIPKPVCRVTLDGKDLTNRIMPRLVSLSIESSREDHADQLDLSFSDTDGKVAMPRKGVAIEVMLGYQNTGSHLQGSYNVDEVEHRGTPDIISVTARSARVSGPLRTRKERSWDQTTVAHIVSVIAGEHGLTPRVSAELAAKLVTHIDQTESDMAFLRRIGKQWDAVATVKAGNLIFSPIGKASTVSGTALPKIRITRRDGDDHTYHSADRNKYTGVRARWHDMDAARAKGVTAGTDEHVKVLREHYASEEDAKRAATAELARLKRGAETFTLRLSYGRPDLYPEMPVELVGWNPTITAVDWIITKVRHTYSGESAFVTNVNLESKATASESLANNDSDDDNSGGESASDT